MNNNLLYYLSFSHFLGIGPVRLKALINYFRDVKKAYQAKERDISEVIGVNIAKKFIDFRARFDPVNKLEELKRKEIFVLSMADKDYPESLKNISDPPICLYIKARYQNFFDSVGATALFFAVVGTRKPTPYGEQIADKFSSELTEAGFVIVSGLAMGIDTIAHRACLKIGGKTVAVLGCGVDIIYPSVNCDLYEKIIKTGGVVLSEFPPGHTVLPGLFISRNRIISGLSKGVLVIEGARDSGALITARHAADQGREVFAAPGPINSEMSTAPNLLLKQGAKIVTSIEDIFEEFNIKISPKKKENIRANLIDEERLVFDCLEDKALMADEMVLILKKPVSQILNLLSLMEIKGVIEKNSENRYQIKL